MSKLRLNINYTDTCYVLVQIDRVIHPIAHSRHDLIWYPERSMTLLNCIQYRPYVKSIVTENSWLISCYDREHVRVWNKEYGWIMPNNQTYGASVNNITMTILGIRQTIPATPLDGGKEIEKFKDKLVDARSNL